MACSLHNVIRKQLKMQKKLLVIEPVLCERKILLEKISGYYDVRFVGGIEDAFNMYRKYFPDVIMLNMQFPDENFLNKFSKIKNELGCSVPVVLAIAENTLEFERLVRKLRFYYFIIKPYTEDEIVKVLDSAFAFSLNKNVYST